MRILNVTQSYAPFYEFGGPPVKVEALASGLAKRGHQVTVLTADWGLPARASEKTSCEIERSAFGWTRTVAGVRSVYLPTWFRYRAMTWNPAIARYCRAELANFDAVHIFGLYDLLGPAVAKRCRARGIPYVLEPIGMFVPLVRNVFLKRVYHARLGKVMIDGAAAVIATAEQEVKELEAGGISQEKIALRRNGVAAPQKFPQRGKFRSAHGIPAEARLILFLGRLSAKKSPDLLLESFAQLPETIAGRQLCLVFAGPDESGMQERLKQLAVARGVSSRVVFTGPVFEDMKWAAYRDTDVFVLPSQNENFGNTAAEAAVAGTPVVITENCGVAPLLKDVAALVVAHESAEVARAVKEILSTAETHDRLSQGGTAVADRLGWDGPIEAMERMYGGLAAQHGVGGQSASKS